MEFSFIISIIIGVIIWWAVRLVLDHTVFELGGVEKNTFNVFTIFFLALLIYFGFRLIVPSKV